MAETSLDQTELVPPGTEGATECGAPGCSNWFVRRSGRHRYCKAPDCTYKRGAPPARELEEADGAAAEVLRRLQEDEEAEVGPALLVSRFKALQTGLRAADHRAVYGALIDVSTAAIWWADRVARGELPRSPVKAVSAVNGSAPPIGLARAAVASHHRTYALGNTRVDLIYELFGAREALVSTELALEQTQGSPQEEAARVANRDARERLEAAERALQSVEAAWRERAHVLTELGSAAESPAERLPVSA